ncbi:type VI secretion protein (plasmid) [Paracoccus sp. Arc7-R13]|uniref:type IV secretory system conjugative DNA transfer family protein n=1 Tax=Paracoccus sp. Arc7-R13 TaxID=2500532 RepID=UPI000FDC16A8|nr:type IV secretory system conjugative DNA transfer family protein [Paracoccus sp. Arc7-R13]AZY95562.1 type VI secretion protein [Paracoccus sp. Arc7-R13]
MNKLHLLGGVLLFALVATSLAYVVGTGFLSFRYGFNGEYLDWTWIATGYFALKNNDPQAFRIINLIWGGFIILSLLFSAKVLTEKLTTFGRSHWQSRRELRANKFFEKPGRGFVVAKMGSPKSRAKFLCSASFPHCLMVAPTGSGKGINFVVPNLLLSTGSAVVLDVKGENFELTSRHRRAMGDKVWRFAPLDWGKPSHRYNPLDRITALPDPDQRQMEIRLLAELFLQTEDDSMKGLLDGGIDLFVACGIFAMERNKATLGEIYRLASAGGDKQKQYLIYADKVKSPAARLMFERLASTNDRTLTSYLSLLMTSGLSLWSNPAIDRATETSDFSFHDFRRTPQTAYFIAPPHDKIKALAPLVRLFFSDLLSSLHTHEPGEDEPWPVMIMLDEFDMLGRMPIVADSIKTLRSYGGNLAIITQTIPALDKIYGEDTRMSLQGGAGVKIYLAPADPRTKAELSAAVGKTTHRVTSRSKTIGKGPFSGVNVSERTEDRDLLSEDEAGRLDKDTVIVLANGQHPIKATRIKYFEDRVLNPIFQAQKGPLPAPDPKDLAIRDLQGDLARTTHKLEALSNEVKESRKRSRVKAALPSLVFEAPSFAKTVLPVAVSKTDDKGEMPQINVKDAQPAPFAMRRKGVDNNKIQQTEVYTNDEKIAAMVASQTKVDAIEADDDDGIAVEAAE